MVQKEIKKKTRLYALIAVLSAIILVSAIYTISNPTTVLVSTANVSPLKVFGSITEMKNFLTANANAVSNFTGGPLDAQYHGNTGTRNPNKCSCTFSRVHYGNFQRKSSFHSQLFNHKCSSFRGR